MCLTMCGLFTDSNSGQKSIQRFPIIFFYSLLKELFLPQIDAFSQLDFIETLIVSVAAFIVYLVRMSTMYWFNLTAIVEEGFN